MGSRQGLSQGAEPLVGEAEDVSPFPHVRASAIMGVPSVRTLGARRMMLQYAATPTLADALFPRIAPGSRLAGWARDVVLMLGFAALVALTAQVQLRVPWTTVPITGQTFGVLVAGGALGMKRGSPVDRCSSSPPASCCRSRTPWRRSSRR